MVRRNRWTGTRNCSWNSAQINTIWRSNRPDRSAARFAYSECFGQERRYNLCIGHRGYCLRPYDRPDLHKGSSIKDKRRRSPEILHTRYDQTTGLNYGWNELDGGCTYGAASGMRKNGLALVYETRRAAPDGAALFIFIRRSLNPTPQSPWPRCAWRSGQPHRTWPWGCCGLGRCPAGAWCGSSGRDPERPFRPAFAARRHRSRP